MSPVPPKGNKNALKYGRYAADAIANWREISALLRAMNRLTKTTGKCRIRPPVVAVLKPRVSHADIRPS